MKLVEVDEVDWDKASLLPAVAQDVNSKAVLMLAYVNKAALELTLRTGYAHYYSRSRNELWKKGATSGNLQEIVEVRTDCDSDALLYLVKQTGNACHTGEKSCFFKKIAKS